MTVFKRPQSSVWQCKFSINGVTVRETTRCKKKVDAQAWEVKRREQIRAEAEATRSGYRHLTLYELAQAWLSASRHIHRDHRNNASRVRKLLGDELRQVGRRQWLLVQGARPGLPRDLPVASLTQAHLVGLETARLGEGLGFATINREMALVQSPIGYAKSLNIITPEPPLVWSYGRNRAASLKLR